MKTRLFFVAQLMLLGNLYLSACSCANVHTPLEDVICYADTTGGLVLELTMTERLGDNNEAKFRIAEVHIGSTNLREITLIGLTSCAWYLSDDDRPGKRFLYFTHPDWLDDNEGQLFTCALSSNIYRMNSRGTRVEYPVGVNGRNDRLAYRNFNSVLGCDQAAGILVNPLRNLFLTNNPGNGLLNILDVGLEFPTVTSVDVYNTSGQLVQHLTSVENDRPWPIDLQGAPIGVYLVVVRDGKFRKALRYVKG